MRPPGRSSAAAIASRAQLATDPKNANLLMLAARVDITAKDLPGAEQKLRSVIEVEPSNMRAYDLLGRIYIDQRKLPEARREFQVIADKQPKAVGPNTVHRDAVPQREPARRSGEGLPPRTRRRSVGAGGRQQPGLHLRRPRREPRRGAGAGQGRRRPGCPTNRWCSTRSAGCTTRSRWRRWRSRSSRNASTRIRRTRLTCSTSGLAQAQAGDPQKARAALEQALQDQPGVRRRRRSAAHARVVEGLATSADGPDRQYIPPEPAPAAPRHLGAQRVGHGAPRRGGDRARRALCADGPVALRPLDDERVAQRARPVHPAPGGLDNLAGAEGPARSAGQLQRVGFRLPHPGARRCR